MNATVRIGAPAGRGTSSSEWTQHFTPDSGELQLTRRGWFWQSVKTAHDQGALGQGSVVAIVDSGFDENLLSGRPGIRISESFPISAKRVDLFDGHGTVVAHLVRQVAPDAEVLLVDVGSSDGYFHQKFVAKGITAAIAEGATVLNISIQFPSAAQPRSFSRPTLWREMQPEHMVQHLDKHFGAVEPYGDQRCPDRCLVCDALAAVPERVPVIVATGQEFTSTCPAASLRAIGAAFQRTTTETVAGHMATVHAASGTASIPERHEVIVNEPPGFVGTSFAAPMLAGFAALVDDHAAFNQMSRFMKGLEPLLAFHSGILVFLNSRPTPDDPPGTTIKRYSDFHPVVRAGVEHARTFAANGHDHWNEPDAQVQPCALCELFARDLYVVEVTDLIEADEFDQARVAARRAVQICPNSPRTINNLGQALKRTTG